jgi:N-acetylglucosaminyl-diphospho-decaprenol L-rhamnosyltransferase
MSAATQHKPRVTLSIVSHGHGAMVVNLLRDIQALQWPQDAYEVLLTLNTPEDSRPFSTFQTTLPLHITTNAQAKGFGANHNAAFLRSQGAAFAVVNPDVRLPRLDLDAWLAPLGQNKVAACAPLAYDSQGQLQDNARRFPTLWSLARRVLTGVREPSYDHQTGPQIIDWAAGYFLLLSREAFEQVRGFDKAYFMYMEDVDLARRLRQKGWKVLWDTTTHVIHDSQRASHRQWRHLGWHLRGVAKYFYSAPKR